MCGTSRFHVRAMVSRGEVQVAGLSLGSVGGGGVTGGTGDGGGCCRETGPYDW